MYTGADPHESRVFLRDIGWELYESLLAVHIEKSIPHFTYYRGSLEMMRPGPKHEYINGLISMIVHFWSYEIKVEVHGFGSATYIRKDLQMGFEVDSSFYIQSVESIQGRYDLDMTKDPPPDLIVDVDLSDTSFNKFDIFTQMGVPEVWRYTDKMAIFLLKSGSYSKVNESPSLPGLTTERLTSMLKRPGTNLALGARIKKEAKDYSANRNDV